MLNVKIISISFSIIFLYFISFANIAYSHPHGWLEVKTTFVFSNKKVKQIRTEWKFDEMTSMMIIEDIDKNCNKTIEPEEKEQFKKEMINFFSQNMKNNHYFTVIRVNDKIYPFFEIKNKTAEVDSGRVVLKFSIDLLKPLDPVNSVISASFYDENYYYDVYFNEKKPVAFEGIKPTKCTFKVEEDLKHTYYYDMVNPQQVRLYYKE